MNIKADLHCHTIASTHAYSTVMEMASAAAEKGIEMIAITDHGPNIGDAPHIWHFQNIGTIPREIGGVKIIRGVEANLISLGGDIDIPEWILRDRLDFAIVSFHHGLFEPGTIKENTNAYIKALENPYVDMLGHSGTFDFEYDLDEVIGRAKELDKLIEINDHTFSVRKKSIDNCRRIALKCKELGVKIAVNTDAHICFDIGVVDRAMGMLDEIDFPEELIVNKDAGTVIKYLNSRKTREKIIF